MKHLFAPALILLLSISSCAQPSGYTILKTFHIQSTGGWDYVTVSPLSDAVYVSHGTQVNILNKTNGDSVGIIKGTIGVHGIVFAASFNKGFISNGRLNNIFVFDANTNRVTDSIAAGTNPDAMVYDGFMKRLVVCNGHSNDATIIDAATNKVLATISLAGNPEAGVSDDRGKVYIDIENKNEVAVLDIKTLKVSGYYHLTGGEEPAGLAINKANGDLFVGCGNEKAIVLAAASGKQKAIVPIGAHCDGVVFDAGTGEAYAANGDGTITVIRAKGGGYKTGTIHTRRGARTIAVDPATHLLYLPTAEFEPQPKDTHERPKMVPGTFQVLVVGKHS